MGASRRGDGAAVSGKKPPQTAELPTRTCLLKQLRKTKLCTYFLEGTCSYGDSCAFAHNYNEVQHTPDLRKTRLCKAFAAGRCNREECGFAHGTDELRSTDMFYKKTLCMWHEKGKCRNGDQCRFAHGVEEIRLSVEDYAGIGDQSDSSSGFQSEPHVVKDIDSTRMWHYQGAQAKAPTRSAQPPVVEPMFVQSSVEPMFVRTTPALSRHAPPFEPADVDSAVMLENIPMPLGTSAFDVALAGSGPEAPLEAPWPNMTSMSDALVQEITRALESSPNNPINVSPMGAAQGQMFVKANSEFQQLALNIQSMSEQLSDFEAQLQKQVPESTGIEKVVPYPQKINPYTEYYPGSYSYNLDGETLEDLSCMGA